MELKKREKDILYTRGVDAELIAKTRIIAEENGYTMAELINMALEQFLKNVKVA